MEIHQQRGSRADEQRSGTERRRSSRWPLLALAAARCAVDRLRSCSGVRARAAHARAATSPVGERTRSPSPRRSSRRAHRPRRPRKRAARGRDRRRRGRRTSTPTPIRARSPSSSPRSTDTARGSTTRRTARSGFPRRRGRHRLRPVHDGRSLDLRRRHELRLGLRLLVGLGAVPLRALGARQPSRLGVDPRPHVLGRVGRVAHRSRLRLRRLGSRRSRLVLVQRLRRRLDVRLLALLLVLPSRPSLQPAPRRVRRARLRPARTRVRGAHASVRTGGSRGRRRRRRSRRREPHRRWRGRRWPHRGEPARRAASRRARHSRRPRRAASRRSRRARARSRARHSGHRRRARRGAAGHRSPSSRRPRRDRRPLPRRAASSAARPPPRSRFDAAARAPQVQGVAPVPPRPSSSSAFDARSSSRSFGSPTAPSVATPTPAPSFRTPPSSGFAQQQPPVRSSPSPSPPPSYRSSPPSFSQSAPSYRSAPSFSQPPRSLVAELLAAVAELPLCAADALARRASPRPPSAPRPRLLVLQRRRAPPLPRSGAGGNSMSFAKLSSSSSFVARPALHDRRRRQRDRARVVARRLRD